MLRNETASRRSSYISLRLAYLSAKYAQATDFRDNPKNIINYLNKQLSKTV